MTSESIYWGHNRGFAFSQAQREGKLVLLGVTSSRCDALLGKDCGEGKLDLDGFVLWNVTPSEMEFAELLADDRFSALRAKKIPVYYLLNTNGEIRYEGMDFPTIEEMAKIGKG